ncbi:MAG: hypothetical protein E6Q61_00175 [Nitrosomonas sp.]|nr:MAG: hypothetical protein E6Q61_00175 [Nitrosomonas sp.]
MQKLIRIAGLSFFFLLLILAALLLLITDSHPLVKRDADINHNHVDRIKQIFDNHRNHIYPGELGTAKIASEDVDAVVNYFTYLLTKGSTQIEITDRQMLFRLSIPLSMGITTNYLNLETNFIEVEGFPSLQSIKISHFQLPVFLITKIFPKLAEWSISIIPEIQLAVSALQQVRMSPSGIDIVYRWQGGLFDKLNKPFAMNLPLVNKQELDRFYRYHFILTNFTASKSSPIPLSQLLIPVMRLASEQSTKGNAIEENRAAILITSLHILGISLKTLFPEAINWPKQQKYRVTLDGREDFAKHFILSAAITAYADTKLSDAIGLYKEIEDARSGSGFSFNDIAADRAGTKFGEKAVENSMSALKIQEKISSGLDDKDLMPAWSDLPEFLTEAVFKERFGDINTPSYLQIIDKIEQRIANLIIFH